MTSFRNLFLLGFGVKVVLSFLFASIFLTELFIPFINFFVDNNFSNPYKEFYSEGNQRAFPYPALMLYILSLPKLLFGWISNDLYFNQGIIRFPLLLADIAILFTLKSWLQPKDEFRLIILYWFSPVLIYISFIHGQLDVIPIALLLISLSYIFKKNLILSAIFLGLSISTKTVALVALPFIALYLLSIKSSFKEIVQYLVVIVSVFLVINLPYLFDKAFQEMVFNNQEQVKVFDAFIKLGEATIYLIPICYLFLLFKGFTIRAFNKDTFLMFLGFSFGIILIFIPPMQGWYFWVLPFLFYFYSKSGGKSFWLVLTLQFFYILYFLDLKSLNLFFENTTDFMNIINGLGLDQERLNGLFLTLLQGFLILNCFWIYQYGLSRYSEHKILSVPFLLGIGGDSGTGKTTLSKAIERIFGPDKSTVVNGDDMHRWERDDNNWDNLTHLNPKANLLHNEINMLRDLALGKKILRRSYDHNTGKFTQESNIFPNNMVIYEGLHPFYLKRQRDLFDLKIFLEPEENLFLQWKLDRDTNKRGKTKEEVLKQIKSRKSDSKNYVKEQSKYADIMIRSRSSNAAESAQNMIFEIEMHNSYSLDNLLEEIKKIESIEIDHSYPNVEIQKFIIEGEIEERILKKLSTKHIPGLAGLNIYNPTYGKGSFAIVLLIIIYLIFEEAASAN